MRPQKDSCNRNICKKKNVIASQFVFPDTLSTNQDVLLQDVFLCYVSLVYNWPYKEVARVLQDHSLHG